MNRFITQTEDGSIHLSPFVYTDEQARLKLIEWTSGRNPIIDLRRTKCVSFEVKVYPKDAIFDPEWEKEIDLRVSIAEKAWMLY